MGFRQTNFLTFKDLPKFGAHFKILSFLKKGNILSECINLKRNSGTKLEKQVKYYITPK